MRSRCCSGRSASTRLCPSCAPPPMVSASPPRCRCSTTAPPTLRRRSISSARPRRAPTGSRRSARPTFPIRRRSSFCPPSTTSCGRCSSLCASRRGSGRASTASNAPLPNGSRRTSSRSTPIRWRRRWRGTRRWLRCASEACRRTRCCRGCALCWRSTTRWCRRCARCATRTSRRATGSGSPACLGARWCATSSVRSATCCG